jgi:hypothetical protein
MNDDDIAEFNRSVTLTMHGDIAKNQVETGVSSRAEAEAVDFLESLFDFDALEFDPEEANNDDNSTMHDKTWDLTDIL